MTRKQRVAAARRAGKEASKLNGYVRLKMPGCWPMVFCVKRTGRHLYKAHSMEEVVAFAKAACGGFSYGMCSAALMHYTKHVMSYELITPGPR